VVQQHRALLARGLHQVDEKARIVELAIVIDDAASKAFGVDVRQPFERLFARQDARWAETVFACEQVVELDSGAIEGSFPPVVARHHEGQVMDQMRGVAEQDASLFEGLHDEWYVALFEVADAAVNQLGAAAGCALAEVALLQQQDAITARGPIERDPGAGGASTHHDHVPCAGSRFEPAVHVTASHAAFAVASSPATGWRYRSPRKGSSR